MEELRSIQNTTRRVREERLCLQRETQMLEMALEELQEGDAAAIDAEKATLESIESAEQELLQCLIRCAMYGVDTWYQENNRIDGASELRTAAQSPEIKINVAELSDKLCQRIAAYEAAQNAATRKMEKELATSREGLRRARGARTLRDRQLRSTEVGQINAPCVSGADAVACEVELLNEMKAEVDEAIDDTLLEFGTALFLRS